MSDLRRRTRSPGSGPRSGGGFIGGGYHPRRSRSRSPVRRRRHSRSRSRSRSPVRRGPGPRHARRDRRPFRNDRGDGGRGPASGPRESLMTFVQFVSQLPPNANPAPEQLDRDYKEYTDVFVKRAAMAFFNTHRHEEWFREIYDPVVRAERVACRRSEAKAAAARLLKEAAAEGGIEAALASYSVVDAQTPAPAPGAPPMISREPDETCLFLGKMPRTVARASVERCFEDAEGFQNVLLGPAWETRADRRGHEGANMFSRRCWVQFDTKEHAAAARDRLNGTRFESDVNFAEGMELLHAMQDTDEGKPKDGGDDDNAAGDTTAAPSENGGAGASKDDDDDGDAGAGASSGDGAGTASGEGDAASGEAGAAKPSSDDGAGDESGGVDHSSSASPVDYQCLALEGPVPAVAPRQVKLNIKYRLRYYPRPLAPEASLPQAVHYNLRCVRDLATALDVEFGLVPAHAVRTIGAEGDTEPVRGGVQELLTLDTVRALSEAQQLNLAVHYLRQVHCYCFYSSTQCKDHGELIALTGDGFQLITESDEDPKVNVDGPTPYLQGLLDAAKERITHAHATVPGGPIPVEREAGALSEKCEWLARSAPRAKLLAPFYRQHCMRGEKPMHEFWRCGFLHKNRKDGTDTYKHFKAKHFVLRHLDNKHTKEEDEAVEAARGNLKALISVALADKAQLHAYMRDAHRPMPPHVPRDVAARPLSTSLLTAPGAPKPGMPSPPLGRGGRGPRNSLRPPPPMAMRGPQGRGPPPMMGPPRGPPHMWGPRGPPPPGFGGPPPGFDGPPRGPMLGSGRRRGGRNANRRNNNNRRHDGGRRPGNYRDVDAPAGAAAPAQQVDYGRSLISYDDI